MTKHKIDITRPQDYMFRRYPEIQIEDFKIDTSAEEGSIDKIMVNYKTLGGHYAYKTVGIYGNYFFDEINEWDVILRSEAEKNKRKVVNILIGGNNFEDVIYSLCNDGNIYCISLRQGKFDSWVKLPDLPQD